MTFIVEGKPVGKERPRKGGFGNFYTPSKTKAFEKRVSIEFLRANGFRQLDPPATRVNVRCFFQNKAHPDPDNVLKATLDALCPAAFPNDRYVSSSVTCEYDKARPRIEVEVT